MIQFFFEDVDPLPFDKKTIGWLRTIIENENKKQGKITYVFCTDEALLKINQEYLQHDYFTDIITFDYVKGTTISADIFVSLPRIKDNATTHNKSFNSEVHRVLAHGILHLCGYKDKTPEESTLMREKEDFYLAQM
ncbi:rRNA maturation RNase YbeY [Chryseobacterium sp. SNU WT5]|uniref:rRNA maturation RNase YbeY n=1 Tax=Chryseobacterium sp. SNU WT5 TaxID=2594269 RepID=UPI00117DA359|nr:rRNA maturation RNase YbeY [Chryseobacterium sp. SNU WT5]QDP85316.1 rRNA maturation RNase YbeY [Chryseobacterium sp. SNU WT5]